MQWVGDSNAEHLLFNLAVYFFQLCFHLHSFFYLSHKGRGSCGFVLPVGSQYTFGSVITAQSMNPRFDQNETKLCISVLSVTLKMFSDRHGLLDKIIDIFWQIWCQTLGLQDTQYFVPCYKTDLSDTMRIPIKIST